MGLVAGAMGRDAFTRAMSGTNQAGGGGADVRRRDALPMGDARRDDGAPLHLADIIRSATAGRARSADDTALVRRDRGGRLADAARIEVEETRRRRVSEGAALEHIVFTVVRRREGSAFEAALSACRPTNASPGAERDQAPPAALQMLQPAGDRPSRPGRSPRRDTPQQLSDTNATRAQKPQAAPPVARERSMN